MQLLSTAKVFYGCAGCVYFLMFQTKQALWQDFCMLVEPGTSVIAHQSVSCSQLPGIGEEC